MLGDPKGVFDPYRQRILDEVPIIMWKCLSSLSDTLIELLEKLPILSSIACRSHQGLLDDMLGLCNDALAVVVRFLAGITLEGDRASFVGITQAEKLLQFLHLAIRQCIHGIDNDGLDTMPGAVAQHIIDDRDNVSKAFSRTCAGGEDITRASAGDVDRLGLMCVQSQRTTCVIVFRFIFAENSRAFTMKNALRYKRIDRLSASK